MSPLTFSALEAPESLTDVFDRIENIQYRAAFSPEERYEIIRQLLLAKIYDEHRHERKENEPLDIQDYGAMGASSDMAESKTFRGARRHILWFCVGKRF